MTGGRIAGWLLAAFVAAPGAPVGGGEAQRPDELRGAKAFFDPGSGSAIVGEDKRARDDPPAESPPAERRPVRRESEPTPARPQPTPRPSGGPGSIAKPPETAPTRLPGTAGAARPAPGAAPGLRYWIELEAPGGSRPVTAERAFESGDRIRLHLYSNVAGYLAVYYAGSSGREARWIPAPDSAATAVTIPAYSDMSVPPPGTWVRFDDTPGVERVFLRFSEEEHGFGRQPSESSPTSTGVPVDRLARLAETARGSKDFLWETDDSSPAETGTYAVSLTGAPLVIEIPLRHR